ncbi:MAG: glycosyltransferase [Trichlorobacter sp.]|uniref:glycosyltransferase n=1 Tax=Trichlorobacter sp. TaxID=2911007 RepID=UPI00256C0C07|nr:glycosyltransferase [Trichlorobacter sp.]MDK9717030.1 glycosyltransferase [Trichlorobacter sp.]
MPDILFVTYGWNETGGGTIFPRVVAEALAASGYRVSVFFASLDDNPDFPAYTLQENLEGSLRLFGLINRPARFTDPDNPQREICDQAVLAAFCRVLDQVQPDLVHFHNFHGLTFAIAEEAHHRGIPSCFTPHNYHLIDPELYLLKNGLDYWETLDLLAESDAVARNPEKREVYQRRRDTALTLLNRWVAMTLAVSDRQKELLCRFGADPKRIAVLHQAMPGTDTLWADRTNADQAERPVLLPLRLGYLGGVLPIKGVHMAVAAVQAFAKDKIELHVFGFAPDDYLEQLRQLDRNSLCRFHGAYDSVNLTEIAEKIDMGIVPSLVEESAPTLVLAELQAMRLPVLAAKIGGIPEFISDGVDGLLYRHDDLQELVSAIRRCVQKPDLIHQMRDALVAPVQTFRRYMTSLETVYAALQDGNTQQAEAFSCRALKRGAALSKNLSDSVGILWQGGLFVHHSLALVNRELCLQLLEKGHTISFESIVPDQFGPGDDPRLNRLATIRNLPIKQPDVTVRHFWPPDFSRPVTGKLVVIQPWEYGSIPSAWVEPINQQVDQLWVPSHFVRDCYIKGGVAADKVQVVPNGVATDRFNPQIAPMKLPTSKGFRFLFVGGTINRKGIDLLLAAYAGAFTADDDVCLVIKEMGSNSIYQGQTAQEMIAGFRQVSRHPELLYLQDDVPDRQMLALYRACQCLVHPYRGEGFGLPIAEAMACGLAPIVTGYGAALDFCPPEIAWLIPAVEQRLPEKRISNLETVDYPWLAEPDLDALMLLLRHAYTNQDEVVSRGRAAAGHIQRHFSWHQAAEVAEACLQRLVTSVVNTPAQASDEPPVLAESALVLQHQQQTCIMARKLAAGGDLDTAVQLLLEQGIRLDSTVAEPYCVLAELLLDAERYQDAREVVAEMPSSVDSDYRYELEVISACALGDDEQTLQLAQKVVSRPRVQVALGTIAARRGALADAEQCFRQALAQDPGCASALLSLGMLFWGQGQLQQAWQAVKQAVGADLLQKRGMAMLSDMAHRLDRLPEAVDLLGQVVRQYPAYRIPAHYYALLLAGDGQQAGALAAVEAFLATFGMDEELLELGLELRRKQGPKLLTAAPQRPTVSLCMIVKNEESFLAQCLHSVKAVADELLLLDTGSSDRTVAIATVFGARVGTFDWTGSFSEARNAVLEQAKGDWILTMDADEQISPQDHQALSTTLQQSAPTDAWSVLIRTYSNRVQVQGWTANDDSYPDEEQADGWYPASRVRLFPNYPGIRYEGTVHELLESSLRRRGFAIHTAPFVVHHYAEVAGLPENLRAKQLRYYDLGKQKLLEQPENIAALFELAVQAGELELYEDALKLWDRLLARCPGQLDALFNKGHVLMALRRYQEALQVSRYVLDQDSSKREAAFNYGTCELYVGDPEKAYTVVAAQLAKDRSYPLLLALQAVLGLATGRIAEACCCYAELLTKQYDIQGYLESRLAVLQELERHELVQAVRTAAQTARIALQP